MHALARNLACSADHMMISKPFTGRQEVMIVVTIDCGSWQQQDVIVKRELGDDVINPLHRGLAIDIIARMQ